MMGRAEVTSARPDANRIALVVARTILDAVEPMTIEIDGNSVSIVPSRPSVGEWPRRLPRNVDPSRDGTWPASIRLQCEWAKGSFELLLACRTGSGPTYDGLVTLHAMFAGQLIVFSGISKYFAEAKDGDEQSLTATTVLFSGSKKGDAPDPAPLRRLLKRAGMSFQTDALVQLATVRVPDATLTEPPSVIARRFVTIALYKGPFLVDQASTAPSIVAFRSLVDVRPVEEELTARPTTTDSNKLDGEVRHKARGIWPLPGGVRQYKQTLEQLLDWFGAAPRSDEDFRGIMTERFEAPGKQSVPAYLALIRRLGFLLDRDGRYSLSAAGADYLRERSSLALFDVLADKYVGILELLVIVDSGLATSLRASNDQLMALLGHRWETTAQTSFRRNWLISLGLIDAGEEHDEVTPLGAEALARHKSDVERLRDEIDPAAAEADVVSEDGAEAEEDLPAPIVAPTTEAANWEADRLDLRAEHARKALEHLELPPTLLDRACAALSAGKHLLLVGPPGTGKTELAQALALAAEREGYCSSLHAVTASADWTTFDTIGGYALQRDNSLQFRPGAMVRAIEKRQWLLIDELNRADVDKAFGELMTVLSGASVETSFETIDGRRISIGPKPWCTHVVTPVFRLIATMNSWDKSSLFRLSFAVQRRFAVLTVDVPADDAFAKILRRHAIDIRLGRELDARVIERLTELWSSRGLLHHRKVGPAVMIDLVRYLRHRDNGADAVAEGLAMFVLPQLAGLEDAEARLAVKTLERAIGVDVSRDALREFRERVQELFVGTDLGDD
jgi:5-methylcytosine-specific restriction protein B